MEGPFSIQLVILSSFYLLTCTGEDKITLGQSVTANQTITSVGRIFSLGFFTPYNSTNCYVGIWYHKISNQTVVWVANRENPLTDSSGVLTITRDGNLVILGRTKNIIWSSNVLTQAGRSTTAILMDDGNLVLRYADQSVLWQSFDDPFGSFLPGMKLPVNLKTGESTFILSWKDVDDPTPGEFSLGIDPHTPRQLIMLRKSDRYWRGNVLQLGATVTVLGKNYVLYHAIITNNEETYFTITLTGGVVMARYVLASTGLVEGLMWEEDSKKWDKVSSFPTNTCENYAQCGPFASCDHRISTLICRCLKGFEPKILKDWDMGTWSGGCVRRKPLECEMGDGFMKLERMKLPDFSISLGNMTMRDCELQCRRNCSCTAYAYSNMTDPVLWKCLIWIGDLIDLVEGSERAPDINIRLAGSEFDGSKSNPLLPIILPPIGTAMLVLGMFGYFSWKRLEKQGRRGTNTAAFGERDNYEFTGDSTLLNGEYIPEVPLFSFASIIAATDNFSSANKLGEGGFGPVYKGKLTEGQEIAVKALSKSSGQGLEEFKNEVQLIAKLQHKNLVRLLGWCIHAEEKILVYEYMPNKSLDKLLFDPTQKSELDWGKRFCIIEGIAQGLLYLHKYSRLRIIHRDLKASNILLDGEMNPKISDFGLARIFGRNQIEANTDRIMGTYGYMPPEYALAGHFSEKSDVYSFGVLLLEIVTGKRNSGFCPNYQWLNPLGYAWKLWKEGKITELTDPSIASSHITNEIERCIHVGLLCVQEDPGERPSMSSVVSMLDNGITTPPSPKKPAFSRSRGSFAVDPSSNASRNHSINDLTITKLEARP
ncbi:G-type lectin S-receptor-like serine/threonine-protein kinase At1g11300 isoform X1 [Magnolia sinica]|uniref:G-type lectin S-receptor-like serine/threonine-protein kinase At1g11300 isoform X1 n=1 Tax=Magnolia sinica TaxID=86752 RepID=UPI0026598CCE|nr:G-type lectin S-receptor-like serine/threonine-protein kinase At1g11300 isoform X1 [Magnolia sinica]XP_058073020.1 G-type lectin S-receptor-like serine/threonine-protein kinase At1g11300 isoform X1 [Magnolia sinica]